MKIKCKKIKNKNYAKSVKLTLSSLSLSVLSRQKNGEQEYVVGGIGVLDGQNSMCLRVLRTLLQEVKSQALDTQRKYRQLLSIFY